MVRKLKEEDREILVDYLKGEPAMNLFILGDVENFGFEEDFQELWGEFTENGDLDGVLLRYKESYVPYTKNTNFNVEPFLEIIRQDEKKSFVSGKAEIVEKFKGIFPKEMVKENYFCELRNDEKLDTYGENVKRATVEDASRVVELLKGIEEFRWTNETVNAANPLASMEKRLRESGARIYYMESEEGEMMTVTQTTAENSLSAMVVGVATREAYRRKGYMSRCLSKMCKDVLDEGKTLCLFYSNPEAGSVYHRLGFQSIGKWTMLIGKKE